MAINPLMLMLASSPDAPLPILRVHSYSALLLWLPPRLYPTFCRAPTNYRGMLMLESAQGSKTTKQTGERFRTCLARVKLISFFQLLLSK